MIRELAVTLDSKGDAVDERQVALIAMTWRVFTSRESADELPEPGNDRVDGNIALLIPPRQA